MQYIVKNLFLPLDADFENIQSLLSSTFGINQGTLKDVRLFKKSVDARKKDAIRFCCSIVFSLDGDLPKKLNKYDVSPFTENKYQWMKLKNPISRPIVVGFGPAGMFAALTLARAGAMPIVLERGDDADTRAKKVKTFWQDGILDPSSNVQFGEGGAGTFSDGKLATGIKDARCRTVLEVFAEAGADKDILIEAKPHIGTDILIEVVKNIRKEIIRNGGEVRFNQKAEALTVKNGKIVGVKVETDKGSYELAADSVILAVGHSARDTFEHLNKISVPMEQKPFAVGARIEHSQIWLNKVQYGRFCDNKALGAADYRLATHLDDGRGVYTFCMCPGGVVVNASSEAGRVVTNGMSYKARNKENCNAALLVGVDGRDFGSDILDGMNFQRRIEEKAYNLSGKYSCVSETLASFIEGKENKLGAIKPSVLPFPYLYSIKSVLPSFVTDAMAEGIKRFDRILPGFNSPDAVLTGPETRSSSPIRILRNSYFESEVKGLYPCGEGAGYAGGITSAAVDGIRTAEAIINKQESSL